MTRFRTVALAALATLAFAGCDDGTSPIDLGGLEPAALVSAINSLADPLQASNEPVNNLRSARDDLEDAGIELVGFGEAGPFPADVAGSTFVYDTGSGSWTIDESRSDAPNDGVRVLWYGLDGTGHVVQPLEERGYIDLTPGQGGDSPIAVRIRATGPTIELMEVVQDHQIRGTDVQVETLGAEGWYSDGTSTVTFSLNSLESENTVTGDVDYTYDSVMQNADTRYELSVEGSIEEATAQYEDAITATIVRSGQTTVLEVRFQGTGSAQQTVTGSVRHNGTTVANVGSQGGRYSFTAPDGGEISSTQATELNALFQTATLSGFLLVYELPLFFPL